MTALPTDPVAIAALVAAAGYMMISAGLGKKKLKLRVATCPVCHHPRTLCTCRWL
jgi:hypothetical protein